jgi:signal peptidase I
MKKNLKKKIVFWKGWGYSIFIAIVIATSFKSAIADWNLVPNGSMKPTIVERDRIVGQAKGIVISLDINNNYKPRWDRFFTKLS